MRWVEHVVHMGGRRGVCRILVGKSEGKRPPGRPRQKWEDNFTMHLQEVEWGAPNRLFWFGTGTGGRLL